MQSLRRPELIYKDVSTSVLDHDEDVDADMVRIQNKDVFKGTIDPSYTEYGLDVHWLYDDISDRIGLIEYESNDRNQYSVLWYYENSYATFFQEPNWKNTYTTIWSHISNNAYADCMENNFESFVDKSLHSSVRIITPEMIINPSTEIYECESCGKRTLSLPSSCSAVKRLPFPCFSSFLFLDDIFAIFEPPSQSRVWSRLGLQQPDAYEQEPVQEQHQAQEPLDQLEETSE